MSLQKNPKKTLHIITSLQNGGAESFLFTLIKEGNRKNKQKFLSSKAEHTSSVN